MPDLLPAEMSRADLLPGERAARLARIEQARADGTAERCERDDWTHGETATRCRYCLDTLWRVPPRELETFQQAKSRRSAEAVHRYLERFTDGGLNGIAPRQDT